MVEVGVSQDDSVKDLELWHRRGLPVAQPPFLNMPQSISTWNPSFTAPIRGGVDEVLWNR